MPKHLIEKLFANLILLMQSVLLGRALSAEAFQLTKHLHTPERPLENCIGLAYQEP